MRDTRAVSPVIGVILMVSITVLLAAVAASFALDLGNDKLSNSQAGPYFGTEFAGQIGTEGHNCDRDVIEITIQSGGNVDVTDLELTVDTAQHDSATIDMPIATESWGGIADDSIDGNTDLIDQGASCHPTGPILDSTDGTWSAGETVMFRVPHSTPSPSISPGDTIEVTVVDTEQQTVVQNWELTATGS